jgi:thiol-disulfide isomerase/thioredoxin
MQRIGAKNILFLNNSHIMKSPLRPLSVLSFFPVLLSAQINFFKGSWEEAKVEAAQTGKMIFVDFYTDWCKPCRMMETQTFSDVGVGEFMNGFFINYRLNAEGSEREIAKEFLVRAYPTLLFAWPDGNEAVRLLGFQPAEIFRSNAESVLMGTAYYQVYQKYENLWKKGRREPSFAAVWFEARANYNQNISRPLENWLKHLPKDSADIPVTEKIVVKHVCELEGAAFDYLLARRQSSKRCLFGLQRLLDAKLKEAVLAKSDKKFKKILPAIDLVFSNAPHLAAIKRGRFQSIYFLSTNKIDDWVDFMENFVPKQLLPGTKDANAEIVRSWLEALDEIVWQYKEYVKNKNALYTALNWAVQAADIRPSAARYSTTARWAIQLEQKAIARAMLEKGMTLADEKSGTELKQMLAQINR